MGVIINGNKIGGGEPSKRMKYNVAKDIVLMPKIASGFQLINASNDATFFKFKFPRYVNDNDSKLLIPISNMLVSDTLNFDHVTALPSNASINDFTFTNTGLCYSDRGRMPDGSNADATFFWEINCYPTTYFNANVNARVQLSIVNGNLQIWYRCNPQYLPFYRKEIPGASERWHEFMGFYGILKYKNKYVLFRNSNFVFPYATEANLYPGEGHRYDATPYQTYPYIRYAYDSTNPIGSNIYQSYVTGDKPSFGGLEDKKQLAFYYTNEFISASTTSNGAIGIRCEEMSNPNNTVHYTSLDIQYKEANRRIISSEEI